MGTGLVQGNGVFWQFLLFLGEYFFLLLAVVVVG
jgi:hypothetical protein